MKVAGGRAEDGIVIGNTFDKYGSQNPIVRSLMNGFDVALNGLVDEIAPQTIHEIGCGEGYWVVEWHGRGIAARGTDFSHQVIDMAREHANSCGINADLFEARSIYDLEAGRDSADLIVCCEVLEHLEEPERGFEALQNVVEKDLVLSVPREPLWRVLNLSRGKYLGDLGNTPGHLNHWSQAGIVGLADRYFDVVAVKAPLPWTMIHCKPKRAKISP